MAVYVYPGVLNMKYRIVFSVILCRVPRETLFDWREPQQFVSSHDENNVFITFNSGDCTVNSQRPSWPVDCTAEWVYSSVQQCTAASGGGSLSVSGWREADWHAACLPTQLYRGQVGKTGKMWKDWLALYLSLLASFTQSYSSQGWFTHYTDRQNDTRGSKQDPKGH